MSEGNYTGNLPASIANTIAGIPAALVPACVKALDRLLGAAVDVPVAWLEQQKAKINAKTASLEAVEEAVGIAVAAKIVSDEELVQAATAALLRKEYRKTKNIEAVSIAALEDLTNNAQEPGKDAPLPNEVDEDWLNIFERYAETASSDRMQKLWGRVLSGEIRNPGKFSLRTLRFLSEFSQADAQAFSDFCENSFGPNVPKKLVVPNALTDIGNLILLESSGLIQGVTGLGGLSFNLTVNSAGNSFIIEGGLCILFQSEPSAEIRFEAIALTPLGQELITLLPQRNQMRTAERVAQAIRTDAIHSCYLCRITESGQASPMKVLWQKSVPVVEG